jgi:hypothetical protein
MLAAATGWDAEDTARQHQEFLPGLLVVVVHDGSKGSCQGLAPQVAGTARHMAESWRGALLNFPESG